VLSVIAVVLALYIVWRVVWRLPIKAHYRIGLGVVVLGMALHHRIVSSFAGTMASPEIPKAVIAVLATGFTTLLLTAVFVLVLDAVHVLLWLLRRPRVPALLRSRWLRPASALVALLLSVYGVWQAMVVPQVRRIEVVMHDLPQAFDGYRVLQLTDIHTSRLLTGPWVASVVRESNALQPDLVVITGDLVDGSVAARADDFAPLAGLRATDGVIAITGNHEYYGEHAQWMEAFRRAGMQVLQNSRTQVNRNGEALIIAGVTDPVAARYGLPLPDLDAALDGVAPSAPIVLLDHRPREAVANARRGVDLQLSGHTHGGHILGMHLLVKRANGGFVSGLYEVGDMQLYVSNGAGLWPGFAVRIGVPSEITEITLRRAAP